MTEKIKSRIVLVKPEDHHLFHLSVSKVKTFDSCAAKYRFSYIEKMPKKDWAHFSFGKFLHEVLERFYLRIKNGYKEAYNVNLTLSWKESFKNWKTKLSAEQIIEAKQICQIFLQVLKKDKRPATIIDVEKSFYIIIDEKILLNGFIDKVQMDHDRIIHVSDYKTTKDKKYQKNDWFQLLTYAFVLCLENPELKKVRGSYSMLRHNFDLIQKEFDREEIMKVEDEFLEYANKIEKEKLFRPNPSFLCNFCDHQEICEGALKMKDNTKTENIKFGNTTW